MMIVAFREANYMVNKWKRWREITVAAIGIYMYRNKCDDTDKHNKWCAWYFMTMTSEKKVKQCILKRVTIVDYTCTQDEYYPLIP